MDGCSDTDPHHAGRRSGRLRRNALIYGTDGDDHVIVASRGGHANNPLWYLNLVEDPNVGVQVGADRFDATARTASAEEKARLWPAMTKIWPAYDEYQAKTERDIPVIVLERAHDRRSGLPQEAAVEHVCVLVSRTRLMCSR